MAWRTASDDGAVIRLDDVSVRYRVPRERVASLKEHTIRWLQRRAPVDEFWALHDVNVSVPRGQVIGIIGRNGAGKSTLLKVVARVLRPTRGRVRVVGKVAPLLEFGAGFHPELTGRENVFLNGALLGFTRAQIKNKFNRIVDFAELWEFIDAPLRTYSSGMVARLGFAIATDVEPEILILDEVLSVGDAAFQKRSFERIQAFRAAGTTILFVSHNLEAVKTMCTCALWLDHGRVVAEGTAEAVARRYQQQDWATEAQRLLELSAPGVAQRWGTRVVEITAVRLLNAHGVPQAIFATGNALVLEMDYHAPQTTRVFFGMAIHRHDGVHISGPNTRIAGLDLPPLAGFGTVRFTIPQLPLLEGLYHISVAVMNEDDTAIYDYHDRLYPFRVVNANGETRERYGLITLRGEWQHLPRGNA